MNIQNGQLYRTIIVCTSIICCSILAGIDLFHGGDGATITGAFAVIATLTGYEFGRTQQQTTVTTPSSTLTSTPS
jgi:hypothetical protein